MGVLQSLLNELDQAAPKTVVEDRRPQPTWPPGFAPCNCGGATYWQDGHGRAHCDRCEPAPSQSLVVRVLKIVAGELQVEPRRGSGELIPAGASCEKTPAAKNTVAEKSPAVPPPPGRHTRHRCRSCYQEPDKWLEIKRGPNSDRVRVECRVCGKFIGYKFVS